MRTRSFILVAAVLAAAVVGAGAAGAEPAAPAVVASYAFDARSGALLDGSGHGHTLSPVARGGGAVHLVAHGAGQAVAFPPACATDTCPHVVLRAPSAPDLNPGGRALAFGAAVRLAPDQTTSGQNIVQKGYSATGSQYKLQIDGRAGRPSCVLVGDSSTAIHLVRSAVGVADNHWHALECRRYGTVLAIYVDGVLRGTGRIPSTLTVRNGAPLDVGGKGAYRDNDQFQGVLDDVWVRI
jgi:Concanavalin A-like lectin/glucanases superfamily